MPRFYYRGTIYQYPYSFFNKTVSLDINSSQIVSVSLFLKYAAESEKGCEDGETGVEGAGRG